jgi:CRISPR-associated protein Cas1
VGLCAEKGVALTLLTEHGRFLGKFLGPVSGNVLLRRQQYRAADSASMSAMVARSIVAAKVANSRAMLQRAAREREPGEAAAALDAASNLLGSRVAEVVKVENVETARGIEGDAARTYFGVFDHLIVGDKAGFFFRQRSRRPPMDNVNALLSFVYTLLTHDYVAALETVGLDPAVGFLHRDRPGRPSLALDLMEELRPVFADRLVLSLINRRQLSASGFTASESGGVLMDDGTRKELLIAYQKRKQEEIQHPFLGEKIPIGLIPHAQALLLARHLRGDLDGYPPLLWR